MGIGRFSDVGKIISNEPTRRRVLRDGVANIRQVVMDRLGWGATKRKNMCHPHPLAVARKRQRAV